MAPNPRVISAFRAMKSIGISEDKVKPVLKNLLKLYEKNWELIEEENYRALADAIFEQQDEAEVFFFHLFLFLLPLLILLSHLPSFVMLPCFINLHFILYHMQAAAQLKKPNNAEVIGIHF